jgi:hypothetical protein
VACERVVFVTSQTWTGNLGGLDGADGKCTTAAATSSFPRINGRKFVAWLSSESGSPASRMVHGTALYTRPDGVRIAADWTELTSGTLSAPIAIDENGTAVKFASEVWTATTANGSYSTQTPMGPSGSCLDWKGGGSTDSASFGLASSRSRNWTENAGSGPCYSVFSARLYCFEQ